MPRATANGSTTLVCRRRSVLLCQMSGRGGDAQAREPTLMMQPEPCARTTGALRSTLRIIPSSADPRRSQAVAAGGCSSQRPSDGATAPPRRSSVGSHLVSDRTTVEALETGHRVATGHGRPRLARRLVSQLDDPGPGVVARHARPAPRA